MTTRQEIQAALDLIRFTNVANDLFDNAVTIVKGEVPKTLSVGGVQTLEVMTEEDIKSAVSRAMDNIQGYTDMIDTYLLDEDKTLLVTAGLSALGVTLQSITDDIETFKTKIDSVKTDLISATTKEQLSTIGDSISTDISSLKLVRNK